MKIDLIKNIDDDTTKFSISYNDKLKYKAQMPLFLQDESKDLEKIKQIKIFDTDENEVYSTEYQRIGKNIQILFTSNNNKIKIYNEEKQDGYTIEIKDKKYFCYTIEDGYICHHPIYDEETQIGEVLIPNVPIDDKKLYRCYLKTSDNNICDGIVVLFLYLCREEYNQSSITDMTYYISKSYSFTKANKYYDKEWVKNNFGNEFYEIVNENVKIAKERLKEKDPFSLIPEKSKRILQIALIIPFAVVFLVLLIILIIILLNNK